MVNSINSVNGATVTNATQAVSKTEKTEVVAKKEEQAKTSAAPTQKIGTAEVFLLPSPSPSRLRDPPLPKGEANRCNANIGQSRIVCTVFVRLPPGGSWILRSKRLREPAQL